MDSRDGVDGNKETMEKVQVTDGYSWFRVDLLKLYNVKRIEVYLCEYNIDEGISVGISNDTRSPPVINLCSRITNDGSMKDQMVFDCSRTEKGRYGIVMKSNGEDFCVREIEIYAKDREMSELYMGCYGIISENVELRDVQSVNECLQQCYDKNYKFSFLKAGSKCFCSSTLGSYHPPEDCTTQCPSDHNPCGSDLSYTAYQTGRVDSYSHIGCFKDKDQNERDFMFKMLSDQLTVEKCFKWCSGYGFKYFALQYSNFCYCGHSYGRHGTADNCRMHCSGNYTQICGGNFANNVYEICLSGDVTCPRKNCFLQNGVCSSCLEGWTGPSCSQRDCSQNNGACGVNDCKKFSKGDLQVVGCRCKKGFRKQSFQDECRDIDECATSSHACDSTYSQCINTEGSYECNCTLSGYFNIDPFTCDEDQCKYGKHNCGPLENCHNTPESFYCSCKSGYVRNGSKCQDIDECLAKPCTSALQSCHNLDGSYSCHLKRNMVVGICFGVLIVLLLILLPVVYLKRFQLKNLYVKTLGKPSLITQSDVNMKEDVIIKEKETNRVALKDLENYYKTQKKQIKSQFENCPKDCGDSKLFASNEKLNPKNRYQKIYPYDKNRVCLEASDPLQSYINASFVSSHESVQGYAFIAAQGPKENTSEDFWLMIQQYSVALIVMLTKCKENGIDKCFQYWPQIGSKKFVSLKVTLLETIEYSHAQARTFEIENQNGKKHVTKHLLFYSWPDKGVPRNAMSLLNLRSTMHYLLNEAPSLKNIFSENSTIALGDKQTKYIVVHCSAGVGRTGTFICMDHLVKEAEQRGSIDVPSVVTLLRKQRCLMVQNLAQYELCYKCMYLYQMIGENTFIRTEDKKEFRKRIIELKKLNQGCTLMQKQFKIIEEEIRSNDKSRSCEVQLSLSGEKIKAFSSSEIAHDSKYLLAVMPDNLPLKGILTILNIHADVVVIIETDYGPKDFLKSMENITLNENFSIINQEANDYVCSIELAPTNPTEETDAIYKNSEMFNQNLGRERKKIIKLNSVTHQDVRYIYNVTKDIVKDGVTIVLSRKTLDNASVMVAALEIAESIEKSMSFDVYQRTFEMRSSQAACLNRLELYEKVYDIAENLVLASDQEYRGENLLVPSMRETMMCSSSYYNLNADDDLQKKNIYQNAP